MAEQTAPPGGEGQQPGPAADAQPSGQPSQVLPDWSPPAGYVAPGMAGPGHLAGSPELAPAAGQLGELGQAADVTVQGTGPSPARSRRRTVIVIAAAAVVLIGGGIGLGVALSGGSSGPPFPGMLLGLSRDTSPDAQQVAGQAGSELGLFQGLFVHPGVALYGTGTDDGLLILAGQWSDAAKALLGSSKPQAINGLESQGVTDATLFPAGPRGGSLACGDKTIGGQSGIICVWADRNGFGATLYFGTASNLSDAAGKTIQVRSAVEH